MSFEIHDDRVSNQEAPITTGFFLDSSGNRLDGRPDNVIQKYMSKVALIQDDYWKYKKHFDNREWFDLELFIEYLMKTAAKDDLIRLQRAREVVRKIQRENINV